MVAALCSTCPTSHNVRVQTSFVHAVTIIIASHYMRGFLKAVLNLKKTSELFFIAHFLLL